MSLDFGVLYEVSIKDPTRANERAMFKNILEQVKLADRVGFTHVWHVEHHFLNEFSHSSAPDAILGAYAGATENIRLGFGAKLIPFNYNHPVRVAEMVASLDQISGGRVEFGTARGVSRDEPEGFQVDPRATRDEWREGLEMAIKAWEDGEFSWKSDRFDIPPCKVVPKPYQEPHPPIWMACTSKDTHRLAGELGLGLLSFTVMAPLDDLADRVATYKDALTRATPLGKFINPQVATYTQIHCAETDEEAAENAAAGVEWYTKQILGVIVRFQQWLEGTDIPSLNYLQEMTGIDPADIRFDYLNANDMCVVGSPETCIEKIRKYQDLGCTQMLGVQQIHGVPHEKVMRSIELMGEHVIPAFRDEHPVHGREQQVASLA